MATKDSIRQRKYNSQPEQIAKRSERNKARREYEKKHGDLPSDVDVNHKKALDAGGTNDPSNLEAQKRGKNRDWRKDNDGGQTYTKKRK